MNSIDKIQKAKFALSAGHVYDHVAWELGLDMSFDKVSWKEELHPRDPDGKFATSGAAHPKMSEMLKSAGFSKAETEHNTELYHHPSGHSIGFQPYSAAEPEATTPFFAHYKDKQLAGTLGGIKTLRDLIEKYDLKPQEAEKIAEKIEEKPQEAQQILEKVEEKAEVKQGSQKYQPKIMDKRDTKLMAFRLEFGQDPNSFSKQEKLDFVASVLEHGTPLGGGPGANFSLKEEIKDPAKLSNSELEAIIKKKGEDVWEGKWKWSGGISDQYLHTMPEIVASMSSKEDQLEMASMLIEQSKKESSLEGSYDKPIRQAISSMFGYRGDVLDYAADNIKAPKETRHPLAMFSKDFNQFKEQFISNWTVTGGTDAYKRAYVAMATEDDNAGKSFWEGKTPPTESEKVPSQNLRNNLVKLWGQTQEFYKQKLAKKNNPNPDLSQMMVTVQRGVAGHYDAYTPAPVESWTVDKATPTRFGKMMASIDKKYSVLTTQVPYSEILMSWESLKGDWPDEKALKGKKEVVLFGGTLKDVQIDKEMA